MKKFIYAPREVYKEGIVLYTTLSWSPMEPNKFIIGDHIYGLGPRYFPLRLINFNHPGIQRDISRCRQAQKEIRDRKKIDWEKLGRTYINL